ncbi:MAG: glycine cleavage system protein GcvH [bacterium]|nr:MAG: glycine cleavage system protein GcvH [bacterium]
MDLKEFKFTKEHEWVKAEGDTAVVGITDYAQKELGDVVYVELPQVGDSFNQGDACSNIESVKAVSDIYAPLSGEITEVNETLEDTPEMVNKDPYGDGWIFKLKMDDPDELNELMTDEDYNEYLKGIQKE